MPKLSRVFILFIMFRIKVLGLDIYGCREALERLDDYTDRELAPDETEKVAQHLKLCHECARKFNFESELVNGLREKIESAQTPETGEVSALKSRIVARLSAEQAANDQAK